MVDIRDSLVEQLRATNAGHPWYGSSRESLLDGLTAADAAAHPISGAHSIWELVLHMTAWSREVARRMAGGTAALPEMGDWPAVGEVSPAAWGTVRRALTDAHAALLAAITALEPPRWTEPSGSLPVPELGTVDVAGMIVGLGQHDAYHTGQIALLRKALSR